ncbi:MAG TPA: outer membrane beta-barrel protein [Terriglobia bacterium]|nr:outer membrane beta-barrel protein [Terriglobia bacterium]
MSKQACFSHRLVGGWSVFVALILFSIPAYAQDGGRSQLDFQATYPFQVPNTAMDSSSNPLANNPTRSAGFLFGYSFSLNKRFRVEGDYAASRNSQRFTGDSGLTEIQGDMNQLTAELQFSLLNHPSRFVPFVFSGTGIALFSPTDFTKGTQIGVQSQKKPAFVYGGGTDFLLAKGVGLRAEYRGLITKSPNFDLPGLGPTNTLNVREPSVGLFVKF